MKFEILSSHLVVFFRFGFIHETPNDLEIIHRDPVALLWLHFFKAPIIFFVDLLDLKAEGLVLSFLPLVLGLLGALTFLFADINLL